MRSDDKAFLTFVAMLLFFGLTVFAIDKFTDDRKSGIKASSSAKATIIRVVVINEDSIKSKEFLKRFNISDTTKSNYKLYVLNCE